MDLMVSSAVAKMIASTITYPHEVIRSHMHVHGLGPFRGIGTVAESHLERGRYHRLLPRLRDESHSYYTRRGDHVHVV